MISRSGELVSYVSQLPPSAEVIRTMDEISNTVGTSKDFLNYIADDFPPKKSFLNHNYENRTNENLISKVDAL